MNFQYFFANQKAIEAAGLDIGFSLYSPGHLLWLAFITVSGILISGYYKKQPDGRRRLLRRGLSVFIVCSEILRDLTIYITGYFEIGHLPLHLCGLALFAIMADAFLEKQQATKQMIAYAFMPGAMAALLFSDWTVYPFLNFMCIHSFMFHGYIVWYFLMRYRAGEMAPDYKGLWKTLLSLLVLVPPLFMINKTFGTNFMFLNEASAGSPLVPLWNIFGTRFGHTGYILSAVLLVIIVLHGVYGVYRAIGKKR